MNKVVKLIPFFLIITLVIGSISIKVDRFAFDDAYIHFRIARNFSQHFAPYFNVDEPIMGTSSFAWTILLSILSLVPLSIIPLVSILNSIFSVAGALVWAHLLEKLSSEKLPRFLFCIFMAVYLGVIIPSSAGLMETPLAMLFVGIAFSFLVKSNAIGWLFLAIAIAIRIEIMAYAVAPLVSWLYDYKKGRAKDLLYLIIPLALYAIIEIYFFGTIFPHTLKAKQIVYSLSWGSVSSDVFFNLFPKLNYPIMGLEIGFAFQDFLLRVCWPLFLFVFMLVALIRNSPLNLLKGPRERWQLFILGGGVMVACAYIFKHVFLFEWYVPLFSMPIIFTFYSFIRHTSLKGYILAFSLSIIPLTTLTLYGYGAFANASVLPCAETGSRVQRYIEVGKNLYGLFPKCVLATSEIGGLGYSFKGKIIDGAGLISPIALKYHPLEVPRQRTSPRIGAIPAALIEDQLPELIVSYPIFVQEFDSSKIRDKYHKISIPAFSKHYEKVIMKKRIWGNDRLYIYLRKDISDHNTIVSIHGDGS